MCARIFAAIICRHFKRVFKCKTILKWVHSHLSLRCLINLLVFHYKIGCILSAASSEHRMPPEKKNPFTSKTRFECLWSKLILTWHLIRCKSEQNVHAQNFTSSLFCFGIFGFFPVRARA